MTKLKQTITIFIILNFFFIQQAVAGSLNEKTVNSYNITTLLSWVSNNIILTLILICAAIACIIFTYKPQIFGADKY